MSVTNENARASYEITSATSYPVPFYFEKEEHLKVFLNDDLLTSGFTFTGEANPSGGSVEFEEATAVPGYLTILREIPITQENSFNDGGPMDAETYEGMFDKMTLLIQQLNEKIGRALRLPVSSEISPQFTGNIVPNALLKMNADGTAFELGLSVDAYATQLQAFVDQANMILGQTGGLKDEVSQLKTDVEDLLLATQNAKDSAEQAAQDAADSLTQVNEDISEIKTTLTSQFSLGDPTQDGSWRFSIGANNSLQTERKESGVWVTKQKLGGI